MTTVNNTVPNPSPLPPEDEHANNELYQQFLAREAQSEGLNDEVETPNDTPVADEVIEDEGDDSGSEGAPVPDEPEAGSVGGGPVAPSASPTDASPYVIDGVEYTPQEMQQLISAAKWAGQLNPLQAAFIDGVLAGDIEVDPATIPGILAPGLAPNGPTPNSNNQQPYQQPVDDDYEYADPRLKQELDELRAQVAQQQQYNQQIAQQQLLTERQTIEVKINEGVQAFQQRYNITDADRDELLNSAVLGQILPTFATSPPDVAIQQAMEMLAWNTPKYRDQYFLAQQQHGGNNEQEQIDDPAPQQQVRQRKMSALASSGGSVPRVAPPAKLTKQERQAAMANEIAASLNGSSS